MRNQIQLAKITAIGDLQNQKELDFYSAVTPPAENMKIPYNRLHVHGNILFAARGGKIHTFDLVDGSLVSTWKHPDVDKVDEAIKVAIGSSNEAQPEAAPAAETDEAAVKDETEPPAKRQKVSDGDESQGADLSLIHI